MFSYSLNRPVLSVKVLCETVDTFIPHWLMKTLHSQNRSVHTGGYLSILGALSSRPVAGGLFRGSSDPFGRTRRPYHKSTLVCEIQSLFNCTAVVESCGRGELTLGESSEASWLVINPGSVGSYTTLVELENRYISSPCKGFIQSVHSE